MAMAARMKSETRLALGYYDCADAVGVKAMVVWMRSETRLRLC
jgi:hypothetical protein